MSGFVVIHQTDRAPVDAAALAHASDAALWRGTDGAGVWVGPGIGLAHRRMETTPEERGVQQPLPSASGACRIVWDGRLDYREELAAALRSSVVPGVPDGVLVLAAYARWGPACVERLEGDFAFALWDGDRRRLLCARDRFGVRPFHYHWDGRRFVGASETVQLLAAGVSDAPNDWMLLRTLAGQYWEHEETVYQAIRHLPPAHLLVVERGVLTRRRYWSPDPRHTLRLRDPREAGEGFLALLRGAVRTRMRAIGPVAAHLSGGLDSSTLVCVAAEAQEAPQPPASGLITVAATYREFKACDEAAYIEAVRQKTGVAYHPVPCDGVWPWDPPEVPFVFRGEPSLICIDAFNRRVYQAAHRLGARVLLSGLGGDELLLTGPLFLADLLARGQFRRFWAEISRRPRRRRRLIWEFALGPLLPSLLVDTCRDLRTWHRGGDLPPWVRVDAWDRWRLVRTPWVVDPPRRFASRQGAARFLAITWSQIPGAAALGEDGAFPDPVETRYPFLDARLVEYLIALPPEAVGQVGDPRFFHRAALAGVLPEAVRCRRGKANFVEIYHRALKERHAHRVRELLREPRLLRLPFFDLDGARRWYEEYLQSDTLQPHAFYALFAVEAWLAEQEARRSGVPRAGTRGATVGG